MKRRTDWVIPARKLASTCAGDQHRRDAVLISLVASGSAHPFRGASYNAPSVPSPAG